MMYAHDDDDYYDCEGEDQRPMISNMKISLLLSFQKNKHTDGIRWNIASPNNVPIAIAVNKLSTYLNDIL